MALDFHLVCLKLPLVSFFFRERKICTDGDLEVKDRVIDRWIDTFRVAGRKTETEIV